MQQDPEPTRRRRVLLSLLSALIAWAAGAAYYMSIIMAYPPLRSPEDVRFLFAWSIPAVLLIWVLLVLPLVLLVEPHSPIFQPRLASLIAVVGGVMAGLLMAVAIVKRFWSVGIYASYAIVVCVVFGIAYTDLLHRRSGDTSPR